MPSLVGGTRQAGAAAGWDPQGRYDGLAGWRLVAGIRNMVDSKPPFSLTSNVQFGFNPPVAGPLGRTINLRATYITR